MIRMLTGWTKGLDPDKRTYGLYPVQTKTALIEGSVAIEPAVQAFTLLNRRISSPGARAGNKTPQGKWLRAAIPRMFVRPA